MARRRPRRGGSCLRSAELDHFTAVQARWAAGVRPLHRTERYVAAGVSAAEAETVIRTDTPSDRDERVDLLAALRAGAAELGN